MAIEDKLQNTIFKKYSRLRRKGVTHLDALKECRSITNELNNDLSSMAEEMSDKS